MYNQKLVASIKAGGKILREFKENVYVPFGSEYSILLKNLNTVRAIVNIYIDGENQVPGGLVLNAGQEVDLQRSLKNGNLSEGNKFKFIERTGAVEAHRGVKLEDGIVRVEYQFEKYVPKPVYRHPIYTKGGIAGSLGGDSWHDGQATTYSSVGGMQLNSVKSLRSRGPSGQTISAQNVSANVSQNDAGITVAGSKSDQRFVTVEDFAVEVEKHTIVLKLLGETEDNKPVQEAVTVKHKPQCSTCGKVNKANAKFCSECGTALEIF